MPRDVTPFYASLAWPYRSLMYNVPYSPKTSQNLHMQPVNALAPRYDKRIYKTIAAKTAPTTPAIGPERVAAELPVATARDVVAEPDDPVPEPPRVVVGVAVVNKLVLPPDPPETPVDPDEAPVVVTVELAADPSKPAGLLGESAPPVATIPPDARALEADARALDPALEAVAPPPTTTLAAEELADADTDAAVEAADAEAEVADEEGLALELETPSQERSKRGVLLNGFPEVMPNDGLGEALLSVSSSVYHQVLTTLNRGQPTSFQ